MLKTRKGLASLVALVVFALGAVTVSDAGAARHSGTQASSAKKAKKHRHKRRHATVAAQDTTGTETPGETSSEGTGESATPNDGPGGHADDPNNPNADHQFNGEE
jgi:hypothetical protein